MEYEEHQEKVQAYFEITEDDYYKVEKAHPDINMKSINEAAYSMSELELWVDDVTVSPEQLLMCWKLVEKIRKDGFPEELSM